MGDRDDSRFNAMQASHDQVQAKLRQLGIEDSTTILPGAETFTPRTDERRLAERNQARILSRDARQKAYAAAVTVGVRARDGAIDCRTASATAAEDRIRQLGLSTAGLEPLRNAAPPPPADLQQADSHAAIESKIDAAAHALLRLEQQGVRVDARDRRQAGVPALREPEAQHGRVADPLTVLSLLDTPGAPAEETREAARALVRHLHNARALLRLAAVRLAPAVEADLLEASAALTAELRQRRGSRRA